MNLLWSSLLFGLPPTGLAVYCMFFHCFLNSHLPKLQTPPGTMGHGYDLGNQRKVLGPFARNAPE